jgi:hypothetical protein
MVIPVSFNLTFGWYYFMWAHLCIQIDQSLTMWTTPVFYHTSADSILSNLTILFLDSADDSLAFLGENTQLFSSVFLSDKILRHLTPLLDAALHSLYARLVIVLNKTQGLASQVLSYIKKTLTCVKGLIRQS